MAYNIQFKRATAARIAEVPNTVLFAGEPLLDTTNNQLYIGDGSTTLSNLKPIQNTQGVLDNMVTKGLLTSTTTTTTTTHNYTTDILQLDSSNSPQGTMSAFDSTTALCALSDSADGYLNFKINFGYPVTTGTLSSGDFESMVQVATTNAGRGNITITWLNNGVETVFYKYIGDMTQTLTREGPFQYRINSEKNIVVFIDPQTTLKSVTIDNNYYCNSHAVIRLTNATYESTESVTTYALNLPTATSNTLGLVKPDGSTITVDGNGVISAVNNSIAKTAPIIPLKYEEQEDGVSTGIGGVLNHTNYTDNADQVYVYDASVAGISNMSGDGYFTQSAANMMSKIFYRGYKIRLDNGLNIAWNIAEGSGFFMNVAVGYYDNGTFVPVLYALNTNSYGGSMFARPALEIASDVYDMGRLNTQFTSCVGVSLLGNVLSAFSPSNGRHTYTISDTTLLTELQKCTHAICTVINKSNTGTTFNYSTGKFANPATTLSDDLEARNTIFSAAENLILNDDVTIIPELKLNCDSTYFKVVNNQLTLDIQAIKDAIDALSSSSSGTGSTGTGDLEDGGFGT